MNKIQPRLEKTAWGFEPIIPKEIDREAEIVYTNWFQFFKKDSKEIDKIISSHHNSLRMLNKYYENREMYASLK